MPQALRLIVAAFSGDIAMILKALRTVGYHMKKYAMSYRSFAKTGRGSTDHDRIDLISSMPYSSVGTEVILLNGTSHLWGKKNETLSDKTAEKEYGLSPCDIMDAINAGELQFREGCTHGYPWLRLLRVEVEQLVDEKYGPDYLKEKLIKKELAEINKQLKALKTRVSELENRKIQLLY